MVKSPASVAGVPAVLAVIFAGAALLTPVVVHAQGGTNAAVILELPSSARALAMGGAYSASSGDDAAIFYNPAQLALITGPTASASAQRYVLSTMLAAASVAVPVYRGVVSAGVQVLDYGSEPEIVPDENFGGERGTPTGARVSAADMVFSAGYSHAVTGRVRTGFTAKLIRQRIADLSGSAAAVDIGVSADMPGNFTLALAVQNLGPALTLGSSTAPLPRLVRLGAGTMVGGSALGLPPVATLTLMAEMVAREEGAIAPAAGAELSWGLTDELLLSGRVGFRSTPDAAEASVISFGGGLGGRGVMLDYAFHSLQALGGGTHRIGVRWSR
jgi:hypothetical protein